METKYNRTHIDLQIITQKTKDETKKTWGANFQNCQAKKGALVQSIPLYI